MHVTQAWQCFIPARSVRACTHPVNNVTPSWRRPLPAGSPACQGHSISRLLRGLNMAAAAAAAAGGTDTTGWQASTQKKKGLLVFEQGTFSQQRTTHEKYAVHSFSLDLMNCKISLYTACGGKGRVKVSGFSSRSPLLAVYHPDGHTPLPLTSPLGIFPV